MPVYQFQHQGKEVRVLTRYRIGWHRSTEEKSGPKYQVLTHPVDSRKDDLGIVYTEWSSSNKPKDGGAKEPVRPKMALTSAQSLSLSNIPNAAHGARTAQQSRLASSVLAQKLAVSKSPNRATIDDAATVSVSDSSRAEKSAKQKAVRALSDANSYVSVGQDAAEKIGDLVDRANQIAQTLEGPVTGDQRNALSTEGQSLMQEIDTVVRRATFNDTSVVNHGSTQFSVDFAAASTTSDKSFSVTVENIPLSRQSLGLSAITSTSFKNSPSSTSTALTAAAASVAQTSTALSISETKIKTIASSYGMSIGDETANSAAKTLDSAKSLTSSIVSSLSNQLSNLSTSLQPVSVTQLLSTDESTKAPAKTNHENTPPTHDTAAHTTSTSSE